MPMSDLAPGTPYDSTGLLRPPAEARGLSALRALSNGDARQYTAVEFDRGWNGVERFIRTLRAIGCVRPSSSRDDSYAVLDVLDADGDIIADYGIPTAQAFRYVKRKLNLRVVNVETEAAAIRSGQGRTADRPKVSEPACGYTLPHTFHPFMLPANDEREFDEESWCHGVRGDHTQPATACAPKSSEVRGDR